MNPSPAVRTRACQQSWGIVSLPRPCRAGLQDQARGTPPRRATQSRADDAVELRCRQAWRNGVVEVPDNICLPFFGGQVEEVVCRDHLGSGVELLEDRRDLAGLGNQQAGAPESVGIPPLLQQAMVTLG